MINIFLDTAPQSFFDKQLVINKWLITHREQSTLTLYNSKNISFIKIKYHIKITDNLILYKNDLDNFHRTMCYNLNIPKNKIACINFLFITDRTHKFDVCLTVYWTIPSRSALQKQADLQTSWSLARHGVEKDWGWNGDDPQSPRRKRDTRAMGRTRTAREVVYTYVSVGRFYLPI